ncbi:MAG: DUF979 domain-containing protein [Xanthomonadaceae bacterium]|nr:DUF979 domain-containing protein [Xanthomonadaceae bacterium]
MITLAWVYGLCGLYFGVLGWRGACDRSNPRRWRNGTFWALLALGFSAGERLPPALMGMVVLALALLAGFGGLGRGQVPDADDARQQDDAQRLSHRLFVPALLIPLVTVLGAVVFKDALIGGVRVLGREQTSLVALGIACAVALGAACALTRRTPGAAVEQSRRLVDAIGWAALLPLLLATLGSVFAAAGVGDALAVLVRAAIPVESRLAVVLAYALGMAAFTVVMGNAFAAFPVITAGIGLPLLVQGHGADPAAMAAIGMLSGYCGTLLTPMAANYNLVPAALLELPDPHGVIRAQVGTALPLLACNVALMYWLVFR